MRLLDLFCGAGGASVGYARAGFEVVGCDLFPQPRYPFHQIEADALDLLGWARWCGQFDVIHASPPCQAYSRLRHLGGGPHLDAIGRLRGLLEGTGTIWCIENVEGAPLRNPVRLCGTMFPELRVIRHRLFESNCPLYTPEHGVHPLVYTRDKRKPHCGLLDEWSDYVQVNGGGNCTAAAAGDAMGISWMRKFELNEAIPPAYTEFLGRQLVPLVHTK